MDICISEQGKDKVQHTTNKSIAKYNLILNAVLSLFANTKKPVTYADLLPDLALQHVKPATIRHYLLLLERDGLLNKAKDTLGRTPNISAFEWHAKQIIASIDSIKPAFQISDQERARELNLSIAKLCNDLSHTTQTPIFFSLPKLPDIAYNRINIFKTQQYEYVIVISNTWGTTIPRIAYSRHDFSQDEIGKITRCITTRITPMSHLPIEPLSIQEAEFAEEICKQILAFHIQPTTTANPALMCAGLANIYRHESSFCPEITLKTMQIMDSPSIQQNIANAATKQSSTQIYLGESADKTLGSDNPTNMALCISPYTLYGKTIGCLCAVMPWCCRFDAIAPSIQYAAQRISNLILDQAKRHDGWPPQINAWSASHWLTLE